MYEYDHGAGDCSITGGYVYRGTAMPSFAGQYFFGDYCTGKIRAAGRLLTPRAANLSTFGEDASGELYLATSSGSFFRLAEAGTPPPATATPTATRAPTPVTPTPAPDRPAPSLVLRRPSPRPLAPR